MSDRGGKAKRDSAESQCTTPLSDCKRIKSVTASSSFPDDTLIKDSNCNRPDKISLVTIYVDGCMNKHTKGEAWASVANQDRKDLVSTYKHLFPDFALKTVETRIQTDPDMRRGMDSSSEKANAYQFWTVAAVKFSDVSQQQNNGAELISLVMGLRIVKSENLKNVTICSDSRLMVDHWSVGKVNRSTAHKMDPEKKALIEECTELRKHCESQLGCKIVFVSGKDNKADLGWHK